MGDPSQPVHNEQEENIEGAEVENVLECVVEYDYTAELNDELTIRVGDVITQVQRQDGGWWRGQLRGREGMFPDNFVKVLPGAPPGNSSMKTGDEVTFRNKKKCRVLFSYQPVHDDELELKVDQVVDLLCEVEDGWWKGRSGGRVGVFPSNFVELVSSVGADSNSDLSVEAKNKKNTSMGGSKQEQHILLANGKTATTTTKEKENTDPKGKEGMTSGEKEVMTTSERQVPANKAPAPDTAPRLPPKPVKEQCLVLFPYTAQNEDELTLEEGQIVNIITRDVEDKGWWKGEIEGRFGVFPDNFVKIVSSVPEPARPSVEKVLKKTPSLTKSETKKSVEELAVKASSEMVLSQERLRTSSSSQERLGGGGRLSSEGRTSSDNLKKVGVGGMKVGAGRTSLGTLQGEGGKETGANKDRRISEPISSASNTVTLTSNAVSMSTSNTSVSTLSHPTAGRVKAPKRRPPSQHFLKENIPDIDILLEANEDSNETKSAKSSQDEVDASKNVMRDKPVMVYPTTTKSTHSTGPDSVTTTKSVMGPPTTNTKVVSSSGTDNTTTSKPSWLEELSRKQADRRSGVFSSEKTPSGDPNPANRSDGGDTVSGDKATSDLKTVGDISVGKTNKTNGVLTSAKTSDGATVGKTNTDSEKTSGETRKSSSDLVIANIKTGVTSSHKPDPPLSSKPTLSQKVVKTETESSAGVRKLLGGTSFSKKSVGKTEGQENKPDTKPARPSFPPSLTKTSITNNPSLTKTITRSNTVDSSRSEVVRNTSERQDSKRSSQTDLTRKSSDLSSSHSTNLGRPDLRHSFTAQPEKPQVEGMGVGKEMVKPQKKSEETQQVGWRTDILARKVETGVKEVKRQNSTNNNDDNEDGGDSASSVDELRSSLISMKQEFNLHLSQIKKELEEERQARVKLESEVQALRKLVNK